MNKKFLNQKQLKQLSSFSNLLTRNEQNIIYEGTKGDLVQLINYIMYNHSYIHYKPLRDELKNEILNKIFFELYKKNNKNTKENSENLFNYIYVLIKNYLYSIKNSIKRNHLDLDYIDESPEKYNKIADTDDEQRIDINQSILIMSLILNKINKEKSYTPHKLTKINLVLNSMMEYVKKFNTINDKAITEYVHNNTDLSFFEIGSIYKYIWNIKVISQGFDLKSRKEPVNYIVNDDFLPMDQKNERHKRNFIKKNYNIEYLI